MKRKTIITILIILLIILIGNKSFAGVEIKEGTTKYTSLTISEAFDICYNLRDGTSTLGTNNLDPHLTTALDWGAVAYLAQSRYGANSSNASGNSTGNKTGVMNMNGYVQTSTIAESRNTTSTNATIYRYRLEEALNDASLKKYVLVIPNKTTVENTRGMAMQETYNWYGSNTYFDRGNNADDPIQIRDSLFGSSSSTSLLVRRTRT